MYYWIKVQTAKNACHLLPIYTIRKPNNHWDPFHLQNILIGKLLFSSFFPSEVRQSILNSPYLVLKLQSSSWGLEFMFTPWRYLEQDWSPIRQLWVRRLKEGKLTSQFHVLPWAVAFAGCAQSPGELPRPLFSIERGHSKQAGLLRLKPQNSRGDEYHCGSGGGVSLEVHTIRSLIGRATTPTRHSWSL